MSVWRAALPFLLVLCANANSGEGFPKRILYAKGGATPTHLAWSFGGEQPVVALDYGEKTVGGYAVIDVKSFKAQGRDADGNEVGYPVLRLSYATHPDGLSPTGCFTRRGCAHYLGPFFDNPVLPANVNRFETYTITHAGTYVAPLVQGQERYVRLQLETPGTSVELGPVEIRNVGVHAADPVLGSFRCSDERLNRVWDMCVWTCDLASIPNNDAWRVVAGRLLPRKLERGTCAGLCETASLDGDGSWSIDFSLSENPHHDSAVGLLFRAAGKDDGLVAVASQPAYVQLLRLKGGEKTVLAKMVLDGRLVDGVRHRLSAEVKGDLVGVSFDGVPILERTVGDLPGGRFGLYVEKEWWPAVESYVVRDANGRETFRDDFKAADADGRLAGWDYTRSFQYVADGAKRDRLVWIGDIWWGDRSCYCGYGPDWPYLRESLKLLAHYQTPEGYVWAAPFAERGPRPGKGEYGHFPSDEFCAWYVPIARNYYLYTGDEKTVRETCYPAVCGCLGYLDGLVRPDGLLEQRIETSSNIASMEPKDPSIRLWTHLVFWMAYRDGAWLAERLGDAARTARWRDRADSLKCAIRRNFREAATGRYRRRLDGAATGGWSDNLLIGSGFATAEEALRIAAALPVAGGSKAHLAGIRGAFEFGHDEKAFAMIENGTWLQLSDPNWEGAHCCTECGFLTRRNWWDESHPDTAVSGDLTAYVLGVMPLEPGYSAFRFAPHVVSRLSFAEGRVPTPHGMIDARWERKGDRIEMSLGVPDGTRAVFGTRLSRSVTVDGVPHSGEALGPGRHSIAVLGIGDASFEDKALWSRGATSDGWRDMPAIASVNDANPAAVFETKYDLGAIMDVRALELTVGDKAKFPREIRIDVSVDDVTYAQAAEQINDAYPGNGRKIEIDLRTVGSELPARFVRLRCRRPPARKSAEGDVWYGVSLPGVRLKVGN